MPDFTKERKSYRCWYLYSFSLSQSNWGTFVDLLDFLTRVFDIYMHLINVEFLRNAKSSLHLRGCQITIAIQSLKSQVVTWNLSRFVFWHGWNCEILVRFFLTGCKYVRWNCAWFSMPMAVTPLFLAAISFYLEYNPFLAQLWKYSKLLLKNKQESNLENIKNDFHLLL